MELINELKVYISALGKIKEACRKEALRSDVAAGQYVSYAACQDSLIELIEKYEEGEASA